MRLTLYLCILFAAAFGHTPKRPKIQKPNYVTVCSEGNQLGGQLTTYAVILGYAWANGMVPYFDREKLLNIPGGIENYKQIFHRLPQTLPLDVNLSAPLHIGYYGGRAPYPYTHRNLCICGMPSYPLDYFHPFRDKIRALYAPSPELIAKLREKYSAIIDHPKSVAVHVRAYQPGLEVHWCLGADYFDRAMSHFPNDHLFVIFSDRISWCKEHLRTEGRNVIFIEGNSHVEDLYLISFCKNIITANSTFSWWAAYLKQDEGGLILVPEKWFPQEDPKQRAAFYPDHYTTLPVEQIPIPDWNLLKYETTSLGD